MDVSRGRCLLAPLRKQQGWSQLELSRRSGYDPSIPNPANRTGYSQKMISYFERYEGKGKKKGKPMSPEAMYMFGRLLGVPGEALYVWNVSGEAE